MSAHTDLERPKIVAEPVLRVPSDLSPRRGQIAMICSALCVLLIVVGSIWSVLALWAFGSAMLLYAVSLFLLAPFLRNSDRSVEKRVIGKLYQAK